ncbi:class I SAM-dependent methyltransferase [Fodinibius sp. SL11]|uniref:class I SAM-dependent methyltransferase n=1 Tax=Fodinibius sp. SL11 TaxID=3425690 RepID=UPI003F883939
MSNASEIFVDENHENNIIQYYRYHSHIYDATRWSFLFGRDALIEHIPSLPSNSQILEVGCGTGKNLVRLSNKFPTAEITGIDLSPDMLKKARENISDSSIILKNMHYQSDDLRNKQYNLILLSYSLTMMGDKYLKVIDALKNDLNPRGYLAVVDFHTSPFSWFKHWMELNHADFSGELHPLLKEHFQPIETSFHNAYFGLWNYFLFIGTKIEAYKK